MKITTFDLMDTSFLDGEPPLTVSERERLENLEILVEKAFKEGFSIQANTFMHARRDVSRAARLRPLATAIQPIVPYEKDVWKKYAPDLGWARANEKASKMPRDVRNQLEKFELIFGDAIYVRRLKTNAGIDAGVFGSVPNGPTWLLARWSSLDSPPTYSEMEEIATARARLTGTGVVQWSSIVGFLVGLVAYAVFWPDRIGTGLTPWDAANGVAILFGVAFVFGAIGWLIKSHFNRGFKRDMKDHHPKLAWALE